MFDRFPRFKKEIGSRKLWTKVCYVTAVGLDEEVIKKYISEQEKYDKAKD